MYTTSDLKKGLIIEFEDAPYVVDTHTASSPQARNATVIHRCRLRNLKTGQKLEKAFRSGETFKVPDFSKKKVQYLYKDQEALHFMDLDSYDQFTLQADDVAWEARFLKEEMEVQALVFREVPIGLELPPTVALEIVETNPAVKGNSATARTKPATLATGHVIHVPEHVANGELVSVDTRTGEFLGRASR